jgi:hypothetical protein
MRYAVRRAFVVGTLITIGALLTLFASSGIRARVLDAYFVALGGVLMLMLIRTVRELRVDRPKSAFDAARAEMRRRPRGTQSIDLERDVELSRVNEFHFHRRLRPILREIAIVRLRRRYGVELDGESARARELVPSKAWDVVRPDRPPPRDRLAPGPSVSSMGEVVAELEKL